MTHELVVEGYRWVMHPEGWPNKRFAYHAVVALPVDGGERAVLLRWLEGERPEVVARAERVHPAEFYEHTGERGLRRAVHADRDCFPADAVCPTEHPRLDAPWGRVFRREFVYPQGGCSVTVSVEALA